MKVFDSLPKALLMVLVSSTMIFFLQPKASAQICAGSSLRYVVRDEKGKIMDPTGVYEPQRGGGIDELKDAQKVLKGVAGGAVKVIHVRGMCNFREPVKLTLKHKGKQMNLTFAMPRFTEYESRSFLVDSIPFRAGALEINLVAKGEPNPAGEWLGSFFPARSWKQVRAGKP